MDFSRCFVSATREYNDFDHFVPSPYFRKSFNTNKRGKLTLTIAVCGFYELYFNGEKVTKGRLAPYISNTDHTVYADRYVFNVEKGENVIGIQLGNGFQNDPAGHPWGFEKANFRSAPKFSVLGELVLEGEEPEIFEACDGFKTHPSPIIFDLFRLGERYDARLEVDGWYDKDFDDSDWKEPIIADLPRGEIKLCTAEPILEEKELRPTNIRKSKRGFIYEFPENRSGVCRLRIKGEKGQEISLRHSDKLKPDGELERLQGLWFPEQFERDEPFVHRDIYICRGDGVEEYTPTFTYHGFCWVDVEGISEEQAVPELLTFVVMNSALETSGGFKTSNIKLSHLQYITRQSDLSNFFYFPTDCPQREKMGWTSDASLSCEQMMLNFHAETSLKEWYTNIQKAQAIKGNSPPVVPTVDWGYHWEPFVTGEAALAILPYQILRYRNDTEFAKKAVPTLMRYLHCITTRYEDGKLNCVWSPEVPAAGLPEQITHFASAEELDIAKYYWIATSAEKIFDVLGLCHHKAFAHGVSEDIKNIFRTRILNKDTLTVKSESQTAQAMALYYGLFDDGEWNDAFDRLIEFIHRDGDCIGTGIVGTIAMLNVLFVKGEGNLALKLMFNQKAPSFQIFVEQANTFWERFNVKEGDTTTHNHHYFGSVSAIFIKHIAGINYNPDLNDAKRVDITPSFPSELDDAEAFYDTAFGRVTSSWKRIGEKIQLTVVIPKDFGGEIRLPRGFSFTSGESILSIQNGMYTVIEKQQT